MACNVPVSGAGAPGANLADPCVCNAPIGSTYVDTVALTAYIKTGPGCTAGDWTNLSSCTCNFDLTDANANVESVTNGDTVTFLGQNGITITVSPTNTVTVDGLTTFGAVAPVAAPADTTQVNMYIDCTTSILYVWCPTSASWLATATAQTPLTVVDTNSIDLTASGTDNHTLQADVIIAPTQGGVDNSLSILATGLYVPDPTDYMVIDDLQDVDTTTVPPVAGDILVWDGTNWTPVAQFTCEQVQDCLAASLPFATYNDATNDWTLGSVDFHSDVDTTTTVPVVGDVLSWDGTNWIPAASALSCEAVQDCLSTSFPFATYNDATNDWTLGSVDFHSDVDTTTTVPVAGDVLSWNGTNWVPTASILNCEAVQDCLSAAFPFATYNDATNDWTLGSINFHSDVDTVTVPPVQGDILSFNGTDWVPQEILPVAQIVRTSKVSNKLAFDGSSSSININGDLLTYLWTISPSAGVTIVTPTAASTLVNCPSGKAEYTLTLTVTSFLTGFSSSQTYEFKTDTIIEVMGVNEENNDLFTTLASAYAWITANDAANAANYQISVLGTTLDVARIVPLVGVRVHWTDQGRVNVGFDLNNAGVYAFTGIGENNHIVASAGTAFTLVGGATLFLTGMTITATANDTISCAVNGTIVIRRSQIICTAATFRCINVTNTTTTIQHSILINVGSGANIGQAGGTLEVQHSYLQGNGSTQNILASTANLAIYFNRFLNTGAIGVTPFNVSLTNCPGILHGNTFQIVPNGLFTSKNVYMLNTALTGPVTFTNNHIIQSGGNNGTNSTCLMIEGASNQPVHMANNTINMLSTNPAMIIVQTATNAAWRFINNSVCNQNGGASVTSSTTNGAIVPVALVGLNYFNNVWNGALNGPLAFNAGIPLGSENIQY